MPDIDEFETGMQDPDSGAVLMPVDTRLRAKVTDVRKCKRARTDFGPAIEFEFYIGEYDKKVTSRMIGFRPISPENMLGQWVIGITGSLPAYNPTVKVNVYKLTVGTECYVKVKTNKKNKKYQNVEDTPEPLSDAPPAEELKEEKTPEEQVKEKEAVKEEPKQESAPPKEEKKEEPKKEVKTEKPVEGEEEMF